MTLFEMAHIMDASDNKYIGTKVRQFRQFQNTSVQQIAKSLHVPTKTVDMIEDGEVQNNKLLLKEAHMVGMGNNHILNLTEAASNKHHAQEKVQPAKPKHKRMAYNTYSEASQKKYHELSNVIKDLANKSHISKTEISLAAGRNAQYLSQISIMRPVMFARLAHLLGKDNSWIVSTLKEDGIVLHSNNAYDRIYNRCLLDGLTVNALCKKHHFASATIYHFKKHAPSKRMHKRLYNIFYRIERRSSLNRSKNLKLKETFQNTSNSKDNSSNNSDLRHQLFTLNKRVIQQKDSETKFRDKIHKRISNLNQAIDFHRLSKWIDTKVQQSISKNASAMSPQDFILLNRCKQMFAKHPDTQRIFSFLLKANGNEIKEIMDMIKVLKLKK